MLRGYVLNLERRPDRKERFLRWNSGQAMDWCWVPAIDGAGLNRDDLVSQGLAVAENGYYTDGALGNAMSHRRQWLECRDEGEPRLVFEDDSCLRSGFAGYVASLLPALDTYDLLFFGYNLNAPLVVRMPGDLVVRHLFSEPSQEENPNRFDDFARNAAPMRVPALYPSLLVWGVLGYAVSPKGAERLLNACFPLTSGVPISLFHGDRKGRPNAIDGMINVAVQRGHVRALACVPPLVIGPNDGSDVNAHLVRPDA